MAAQIIQGFFLGMRPGGQVGSVQPKAASPTGAPAPVDPARLGLARGGGNVLPAALRGRMEAALGADFSMVRVHVGPQPGRIGALAFTAGTDIYFAPGRFQPDTAEGRRLIGHELVHVVQQRQGRVRGPVGAGIAVVQDRALEAEADRLGQRAALSVDAKLMPARPAMPSQALAPIPRAAALRRLPLPPAASRQAGSIQGKGPRGTPPPAARVWARTVQRCPRCHNTACRQGEICGHDHTEGGLFPTPAIVVPYNQARNFPSGGASEFEHPIAGAALRASGVAHNYRHEYTIQTPRTTHRGGVSGAGGGITSTGSSSTARDYVGVMGATLAVNPVQAVRDAAIEQINAHYAARPSTLNRTSVSGVFQWVQSQVPARITQGDADTIKNAVMNAALDRAGRGGLA